MGPKFYLKHCKKFIWKVLWSLPISIRYRRIIKKKNEKNDFWFFWYLIKIDDDNDDDGEDDIDDIMYNDAKN